jgi:hypothetical protein
MKNYLSTIIVSLAIIISVVIIGSAYKYKFKSDETIVVTGLAEKDFTSDLIVWKGRFSRNGFDLKQAYASVKQDEAEIKKYLIDKGLADSSIVFSSIEVQKNYQNTFADNGSIIGNTFSGYSLSAEVKVDSKDINLVEKISREVTELLQKGIEFNSERPQYYYSRLNELKIDLLAKAAVDANLRASTIALNSGLNVGKLKKAVMGVFQITGKNDNEAYSYGGSFNTTSREKTASITLKVEYLSK